MTIRKQKMEGRGQSSTQHVSNAALTLPRSYRLHLLSPIPPSAGTKPLAHKLLGDPNNILLSVTLVLRLFYLFICCQLVLGLLLSLSQEQKLL